MSQNQSGTGTAALTVPIGKFEAFFGIFHGSNRLYEELKLIRIGLV
jgi:hypothetical protein